MHLVPYSKNNKSNNLELFCKYKHFTEPWYQNKDLLNQPLLSECSAREVPFLLVHLARVLFPFVKKRHCPQTLTELHQEHTMIKPVPVSYSISLKTYEREKKTHNETLQKIHQEENLLLRNKEGTSQNGQKHQQCTPQVWLLWEDGQRPREKTGKKRFLLSKMDHVP